MNNISLAGVVLGVIAGVAIQLISNSLLFWLAVGLAPVIALAGLSSKRNESTDIRTKAHSA